MRRALFISLALLGASTAAAQTSPTEVLAPNQTLLEVQSTGQSYVAPDQATLTEAEIEALSAKIVAVAEKLGATLRQ